MTHEPDGYEAQTIKGGDVDAIIDHLSYLVRGPREAMALLTLVIRKLNTAPFREDEPPSNEEISAEILVALNSIQKLNLQ